MSFLPKILLCMALVWSGLTYSLQAVTTLVSNLNETYFFYREKSSNEWITAGTGKKLDVNLGKHAAYDMKAVVHGYVDKNLSVKGDQRSVKFVFLDKDKVPASTAKASPVVTPSNPPSKRPTDAGKTAKTVPSADSLKNKNPEKAEDRQTPSSVSPSMPRATASRPSDSQPPGGGLLTASKADTKSESLRSVTPQASSLSVPDAGNKIAAALAKEISNGPIKIGIDKFLYQGEDSTPFSLLIRKQLSVSLQSTGKFTEVVRDKIASLQNEKKFQQNPEISSGESAQLKVDGAVAILQGQFFLAHGVVTIQASLVFLDGGKEITAQETVAESVTGARIGPK